MIPNRFAYLALITLLALLSGCIGAAINTSTLAVKAADRDALRTLAEAGDSIAQYELGKSYCCTGPGFSSQTGTEWLCKSAHQGNADAMYELGRIDLGDISRSPAPGQKLRHMISSRKSPAHAFVWLSLASHTNHADAKKLLAELEENISVAERAEAARMMPGWQTMECEYNQVFGQE
jgi:TPR repeat protein